MEQNITKIFWTGDWDSTFRLIQLSHSNRIIQPVYISGYGRISEQKELETMNVIIELLRKKTETKAVLLPIDIVDKKDIPVNEEITKVYHEIRKSIRIGT